VVPAKPTHPVATRQAKKKTGAFKEPKTNRAKNLQRAEKREERGGLKLKKKRRLRKKKKQN